MKQKSLQIDFDDSIVFGLTKVCLNGSQSYFGCHSAVNIGSGLMETTHIYRLAGICFFPLVDGHVQGASAASRSLRGTKLGKLDLF
jgi:hypothetical protein